MMVQLVGYRRCMWQIISNVEVVLLAIFSVEMLNKATKLALMLTLILP